MKRKFEIVQTYNECQKIVKILREIFPDVKYVTQHKNEEMCKIIITLEDINTDWLLFKAYLIGTAVGIAQSK